MWEVYICFAIRLMKKMHEWDNLSWIIKYKNTQIQVINILAGDKSTNGTRKHHTFI